MITLGYNVAGLGLGGTIRPGHQTITITAGHIQLAPRIPVTRPGSMCRPPRGRHMDAHVRPLGAGRFQANFTAPDRPGGPAHHHSRRC
jgi:hypothetical protein